jgi:DNA-binding transcriptional LysR family regulator
MRVDYLGLEAFVAIARLGSFSRAADYLSLSQTALSHRIRKIEAELGVQLLVRTTREVTLTKAGQALLPEVQSHLAHLADLYSDIRDQSRQKLERVSFACVPTVAHYYLPEILRRFSASQPGITINLYDVPVAQILELVRSGDVEFGISLIGAGQWDLDTRPICNEPYILLVHRDHPLANRGEVSRADLVGQPFVRIRTQSSNRQLVEDGLGEFREGMVWRYEVQNAATAMSLVAAGAAVTVLPELTARLSGGTLVGLRFSDVGMSRTLGTITRRGVPLSSAASALMEMICDRLGEI